MPQDTTIYWDGNSPLPPEIDSLTFEQVTASSPGQQEFINDDDNSGTLFIFLSFTVIIVLVALYNNFLTKQPLKNDKDPDLDEGILLPVIQNHLLVYAGNSLKFDDELLEDILIKRFPFYDSLSETDKVKFIKRLRRFIDIKTFIIHDISGFKEMPILISATAIQISFGLDKYLLPNFDTFNIYPKEFLGTHPFVRFLIGNVTGNTINLSWKHFLEGFKYPDDGQNVGMHEIAHALYYQTFVVEKNVDKEFRDTFTDFDSHGNKVYNLEKLDGPGLYSDYAMRDFQEFWAESVEIFFEKPVQMKAVYPGLYATMSDLLNQDPAGSHLSNTT